MTSTIVGVLAGLSLIILIGMGVAMTLSIIFSPDEYEDIRDTDR